MRAYRKNQSVHTGVDEIIHTDSYEPQVGDEHNIAAAGMYPFTATVTEISGEKAQVAQSSGYGVWMPKASVAHFVNDLRGVVDGPRSSNPIIEAVLNGEAEFLGKGDDGLSFRVGDTVVKVSTTVPYQPFNPGHRTPAEAVARLRDQWAASEEVAAAGVPGILPTEFLQHGDKGFILKPYVEIPDHLDRKELDAVAESVEAAHRAGWVFGDEIQVGVLRNKLYHFDTGKLMRSDSTDPDYWRSDAHHDIEALKRLFSKYGQLYLTASERVDPTKEFYAIAGADLRNMTEEGRKRWRSAILRLRVQIAAFIKNHPDHPSIGFWSDPEYFNDEIKRAMNRLKDY